MNKKKKRGFTLVELLVVIAILAVLATVAILGYSSFIKKANISNDRAIITQMNNALLASEVFDEIPNYCDEAVDIAIDAGFILENLTPSTSGYNYAYDLGRNRFILLDEEFVYVFGDDNHSTDKIKIQIVVRNDEELQQANTNGYSTYLREKFEFKDDTKTITTSKGIDVGKNVEVAVIKYTNSSEGQNVVIRTNADNLTLEINDASSNGKIYHYGIAGYLNIIDCAPTSYYENGAVELAEIATGRIVLKTESEVKHIHFAVTNNEFDNIIVARDSGVDLPEFSRDAVTIGNNGTLVVELQESETESDYIWLYKQGTLSQIVIVDTEITGIQPNSTNDKLVGTIDGGGNIDVNLGVISQTQEKRKAAAEIANNYSGSHVNTVYSAFDLGKNAPETDSLGTITGGENISQVVSEGAVNISTTIAKATCQHNNLPNDYASDEKEHYKVCLNCDKKLLIGEHDSDGEDDACSVCGYKTGKIITTITVTDEASLLKAFETVNAKLDIENDKHHEYKIVLPGGDFGGTYNSETEKYLANVYVIRQYPNWNNSIANSNFKSGEFDWKDLNNTSVTIVGSSDSNNQTIFRGIIVVVGHGYSNGGWEVSSEVASTTIKNLNFDHSNLYGIKNGGEIDTTWKFKDGNGANPIIGMATSQNITVTDCTFKNTGRMIFGYSQNNDLDVIINSNNKVLSTAGYSYNPQVINCKFDNITCAVQGYFHGSKGLTINNCSGTVGNFVNDQAGSSDVTVEITDCNITFTKAGYLLRTLSCSQNIMVTNCVFDRTKCNNTATDGIFVVKKNDSNNNNIKIKFSSCTFSGGHCGINLAAAPSSEFSITFDKCTGITLMSDLVLGENITAESGFVHFINE